MTIELWFRDQSPGPIVEPKFVARFRLDGKRVSSEIADHGLRRELAIYGAFNAQAKRTVWASDGKLYLDAIRDMFSRASAYEIKELP